MGGESGNFRGGSGREQTFQGGMIAVADLDTFTPGTNPRNNLQCALGNLASQGGQSCNCHKPDLTNLVAGHLAESGTDDLRESPIITLAERLIGRGYELKIHDPEVEVARLIGSNREFIEREIPHFADLMCADPSVALEGANIIVIAHEMRSVTDEIIAKRPAIPIIDLVGVRDLQGVQGLKYLGICW